MSNNHISDNAGHELSRMLKRLLRREGVAVDKVPNPENWNHFVQAVDQMINEHAVNRRLLKQSVEAASMELEQAYKDLKGETELRLAQADTHKRELESLVQKRTAELQSAQLRLKKTNRRLEYDATHDDLTGTYNRKHLMKELGRRVSAINSETGSKFCVFFIDFDRFKQVNDSFGHLVGDKMLVKITHRLSVLASRDTSCLARLGGDEFVLVVGQLEEANALSFAKRICDAFAQPICVLDNEISIAASVGVVIADATYTNSDEIVRDADIAMYRAKAKGDCYQLFDETMRVEHLERIVLETELEIAVREKQFRVKFEPIVDTQGSTIYSIESLVRWIHPEKGIISPGKFIPLAEELGLVIEIDRIVFQKTCEKFREWQVAGITGPDQKFNVNLSSGQLQRTDIVPFLINTITASSIRPSDVILEITESYLLEDTGVVMKNLNKMQELGFSIFVDDFGTGYSSLSYLAKYPIQGIKIDRSFVRDLDAGPESKELIRSIVAMAEALNLKVVVEGVETVEQLRVVTGLGCHYIQGFLFTRPMDADQTTKFLIEKPYLEWTQNNCVLTELDELTI